MPAPAPLPPVRALKIDFPERLRRHGDFEMPATPLPRDRLVAEGVSPPFLDYLSGFPGLVEPA